MKRILAPILLLTLLFPSLAYGVTMDDLVYRDGIHYKKFSTVPFTGKVTGKSQGSLKNGKWDGPWIEYHKNGQLLSKQTHKDGKRDGLWVLYHDNGQLFSKETYKNGVMVK
jgi:antitoxin component YwqK of YwqJK toxin-antitoxin module